MVDITIQHKRSAQSGKAPTTSQLQLGELAVNTYDGDIYLKKNVDGVETVVTLKSSVTGTTVGWIDVTDTPTTLAGYGITDAFSGDYDDLTDKPDLSTYQLIADAFSGDYNDLINKPQLFDGQFPSLDQKPTTIAGYGITDAFDGDYSSLANTPFIPVDITDLTDATGIIFSGDYVDLINKPTIPSDITDLTDTTNALAHYTNSDVDAHLNSNTASSGEILSWNGSDYVWVADQTSLADLQAVTLIGATTNTQTTFSGGIIVDAIQPSVGVGPTVHTGNFDIQGTLSISGSLDMANSAITASTLNTHTIPGGTGTLALTSDIPVVPVLGQEYYTRFGTSTSPNFGITTVFANQYFQNEAGTGDIEALFTVTSGFTKALITLNAMITNVTNTNTEAVITLERSIAGGAYSTVQTFVFPVGATFYGGSHFTFLDTHGASAGQVVSYKLRNDMANGYASENLRLITGGCGDTFGVKELQ